MRQMRWALGSMSEGELIGFSKIKPPGNWEKAYNRAYHNDFNTKTGHVKENSQDILGYTKVLDVGGSSFTATSKV